MGLAILFADDFSGFRPVAIVSAVIDAVCIAGLFCHLRSRPVVSAVFWRVVLAVYALKVIGPACVSVANAMRFEGVERRVAIAIALSALLALPMICALWRYSFSRTLWSKRAAT